MTVRSLFLLSLSLGIVACGGSDTDTPDTTDTTEAQTIVEIAAATDRFSILVEAVTRTGLAGALDGVTVFAPNNDAFAALLAAIGASSLDDVTDVQLATILKYHVLAGSVDSAAAIGVAQGAGTAQALGGSLDLTLDGSSLKIDAATVITPDIIASNGIIHKLDKVITPAN
jgi:transforming growth factor-beta-induced protein